VSLALQPPPRALPRSRLHDRAALKLLLTRGELGAALALAAACLYFAVATDAFATSTNFRGIMTDVGIVLLVALGQNLVILAGEIDVSVGSILALAAVSAGFVAQERGGLVVPLLIALGVGVCCGMLNGLLITRLRVPSVVVTLGGLFVYRGISLIVASGREVVSVPASIRRLQTTEWAGLPLTIVLILGVMVVLAVLRRNVPALRDLRAIGSNRRAAEASGVAVRRGIFAAFAITGLLTGFGAIVYLAQVGGAQTIVGTGLELQVIAACAIGGTSIQGGRGSDVAPLLGAALIGVLSNGILLLGVPAIWSRFVYGICILVAVSGDRLRRVAMERLA
jgi:ribose/xylose/arabinose/galactoside ABC-type transport system permease subunit